MGKENIEFIPIDYELRGFSLRPVEIGKPLLFTALTGRVSA